MGELVDIYDDNRVKTGEVIDRTTKLEKGKYILYVLAIVKNNEGRYLVTRRSLDKKWAAGKWEIPGGGTKAGETSLEAVKREVFEETGLDVSLCDARVVYSYKNEDEGGDNYFVDMYLIEKDFSKEDVKCDMTETMDIALVSLEEIEAVHKKDGFLHYERLMTALTEAGEK
ncbi:MAG: NUDIX hydrolase [Lachnospiraceae bacterium]|nr:NUDIX hydrolase [Lachnospiraceae bacterium]